MRHYLNTGQHDKSREFIRLAVAGAIGQRESIDKQAYASARYGEKSLAARIYSAGGLSELANQKAAVAAGGTLDGSWAELLVDAESAATAFFAFVRERALIGRIAGFRNVPLDIRMVAMVEGLVGEWIGEGRAVPVGEGTFARDTLPSRKVASLTVVTREVLDASDPVAETLLRNDLAAAVAEAIDATFLDPANDGIDGVRPASITHDATVVAPEADGLAAVRALIAGFEGDLERAALIAHPEVLAGMYDQEKLPGLSVRGGNALGIPAFPSKRAGNTVSLIDPALIAVGAGSVALRTATDGTIEMSDTPANNSGTPTPATLVSLFQTNSVAVMALADANWKVAVPHVRTIEWPAP